MDTGEWIRKAQAGDKDALVRLVMDKKDEYYRLAYVYLNNREDALDALQEMIVLLFRNIRKLKDPGAFYSWSKTILVNCCRSALRKRGRVVFLNDKREEAYHENYHRQELQEDLERYLKKLNRHQQEAIRLRYFLDMDYETISVITGTALGTVKSRISLGLDRLRKLLGGEYDA